MAASFPALSTVALSGVLAAACMGEPLDAGTTFVEKDVPQKLSHRAAFPAVIHAMTMDADDLYATCEDGWVYRVAKRGGTPPLKLAEFPGPFFYAWGIAVDDQSVFVTALADAAQSGVVLRIPKGGGSAMRLASNQFRPWGIALDPTNVYWIEQGPNPAQSDVSGVGSGAVLTVPKAGGTARPLVTGVTAGDSLVLDGESLVWHELHAIQRAPKSGGTASAIVTSAGEFPASNLVASGGQLFYGAQDGAWSIFRVPDSGGTPTILAADISQPASLALLGDTLFWSSASGSLVGIVDSVPSAGGGETVITPSGAPIVEGGAVSAVLVDDSAFYIAEYVTTPSLQVSIDVLPR